MEDGHSPGGGHKESNRIGSSNGVSQGFGVFWVFFKKNYFWFFLFVIVVFGFSLRLYHVDYPVVGYHNWKEVHYLSEARNFVSDGFFKHGFFIPAWDYPSLDFVDDVKYKNPSGVHTDSFPTISVAVALFFKIFGPHLVVARLVSIFFVMAAVVMFYFFVKELFRREDLALVSAFFLSVMPLTVFFGRQTQLINPALFFMVSCFYFYVRWYRSREAKMLFFTCFFLAFTLLTKYDFFYVLIPIAATLPYRDIFNDLRGKRLKMYVACVFILLPVPLWLAYSKYVASKVGSPLVVNVINLGLIFTSSWWHSVRPHVIDNFTVAGGVFVFLGVILSVVFFKRKSFGHRFLLFSILGAIPWIIFVSGYLKGHAYHWYPLVHLVALIMAFFVVVVSSTVQGFFSSKLFGLFAKSVSIVLLLCVFLYLPFFTGGGVFTSIDRLFDTQFIGLDLAGEYIGEHSLPFERVIFPGHQSFGVLWHADRKGYSKGYNGGEEAMIFAEQSRNVSWVFVYQWGMKIFDQPEKWDYISSNYGLKQFAFEQTPDGGRPFYFLLKKGGSFNLSEINSLVAGRPTLSRDYEFSGGKRSLYYINLE